MWASRMDGADVYNKAVDDVLVVVQIASDSENRTGLNRRCFILCVRFDEIMCCWNSAK